MVTSYDYDSTYAPAAPVMPISVSSSGDINRARQVIAFIDTGADATMIPVDHTIHGVRAVALPRGAETILGRDVLNQFIVLLNGLAHVVQMET